MTLTALAPSRRYLESERLLLTPFQTCNIRTHYRWNNDKELNQLDSEGTFAPETFGAFARRFEAMALHPSPTAHDYEVHLRSGKLIGVAHIAGLDASHHRASLGVTLGDRSAWGKGYGREVVELLIRHAFEILGVHRLTAVAYGPNPRWEALLTAMGFQQEGRLRDYLYREGTYWDKTHYALLATEYGCGYALAA